MPTHPAALQYWMAKIQIFNNMAKIFSTLVHFSGTIEDT